MLAHISSLRTAVFSDELHLSSGQPVLAGARSRSNLRINVDIALPGNGTSMNCVRRLGGGCFAAQPKKGLKSEFDSGGEDVFDLGVMDSGSKPEHLVMMVNGIVGSSADWKFAAEQFVKKFPDRVIVHLFCAVEDSNPSVMVLQSEATERNREENNNSFDDGKLLSRSFVQGSECNYSKLTFDGVDLMGERLAKEVLSVIRARAGVRKISFVAHSLGGLVARYAIGKLYEQLQEVEHSDPPQFFEEGRIGGLEPMNFITFATPHLGSRGRKHFPLLCAPFLETRAPQTAHLVAGRTGKHLFLMDNDNGKPPLLLRMAKDCGELRFISALRAFKRRAVYANVNYDYMVGWRTSSIRRQNELPTSSILTADAKYSHIVHVEQGKTDNIHEKLSSMSGDEKNELEEEMINGLIQLPWERVDVSFHRSKQRYVAHSTIQVKTYWLNSDGADVVFHMIDNFLL